MSKKTYLAIQLSPAVGSRFRDWIKIVAANGPIPMKYWLRVIAVGLVTFIGKPFRLYEAWKLKKDLKNTSINESPVFILGHWRSGTTHLQNLLTLDDRTGYVSNFQCLFPHAFLKTKFFKLFLDIFMPKTRPMDNMKLELNTPQEEELGMVNMGANSFYHAWHFPKHFDKFAADLLWNTEVDSPIFKAWKSNYTDLLKTASYNFDEKPLVLKNPSNTARIKWLLKLFPKAKFVHIARNPYRVYLSTHQLYKTALPPFQLQDFSKEQIDEAILSTYAKMMQKYFDTKSLIPKDQLVEIKFEDLESAPIETLESIYSTLNLPDFKHAQPSINAYLESRKGYKKNELNMNSADIKKINNRWRFALENLGYDLK